MLVLGLNGAGPHDAAACLVHDGRVLCAVEEERLSRSKHAVRQRPYHAMQWCLEHVGVTLDDVDVLATSWDLELDHGPGSGRRFTMEVGRPGALPPSLAPLLERHVRDGERVPPVAYVSHHLAHAASAYRCSGFDEAAVLVVDGEGDGVSTTLARGRAGDLEAIELFPPSFSLGHYYAALTQYLGFNAFSEGKVMGLAAYGRPHDVAGDFELTADGYRPGPRAVPSDDAGVKEIRAFWFDRFVERHGPGIAVAHRAWRGVGDEAFAWAATIASSAQAELERVLCHLASVLLESLETKNLVIAGGVALNCSANGRLARLPAVGNLFVQPMASDSGTAIGAALEADHRIGGSAPAPFDHVFLGPSFSDDAIADVLREAGATSRRVDDAASAAVDLLAAGRVVGWFQGAMEGGPRALGHRSILASPHDEATRDRVNDIKRRERWRPLAPSMRQDRTSLAFGSETRSPFMIVRHDVEPGALPMAPAVVHVDGSTRVQTVDAAVDPLYASLLDGFESVTGIPCVINTSFNDETEPIVCTPRDALRTYFSSGIDALVIGRHVLEKSP